MILNDDDDDDGGGDDLSRGPPTWALASALDLSFLVKCRGHIWCKVRETEIDMGVVEVGGLRGVIGREETSGVEG